MSEQQIVKIVADSINTFTGDRITTFVLPRFPKVLLQELNTHRAFSRNAASSRAIPVEKMIERVQSDPYIPKFTKAKKGMSGIEDDDQLFQEESELTWLRTLDWAIQGARKLLDIGVHKQNANRLLEPFARVPVIVTATEWDNFFKLRCDQAAHPDFREVAILMQKAMARSEPVGVSVGAWHIPLFDESMIEVAPEVQRVMATARCARVSYTRHDGSAPTLDDDRRLHNSLLENGHLSPFEHCAKAITRDPGTRNFRGWKSYRATLEDERLAP